MKLPFPEMPRAGFLLYRLLQLRYASREQIKRCIFSDLPSPKSQKAKESEIRNEMIKGGVIKEHKIKGLSSGLYYVTQHGCQILSIMLMNPPKRKNGFTDAFNQIDMDHIESNPNPGAKKEFQMEHHKMRAEVLLHFIEKEPYKYTDKKTELEVPDLPKLKPDQTLIYSDHIKFIEAENKNELKEIKDKIRRYIRYYFSGGFKEKYPEKKYGRVYIFHHQKSKLEELIKFQLKLTWRDVGFKEPIHRTNDFIGRNLFRFGEKNFNWQSANEWKLQNERGAKNGG